MLKYFNFTESELIGKLARLDELEFIELLPQYRIKLHAGFFDKISKH